MPTPHIDTSTPRRAPNLATRLRAVAAVLAVAIAACGDGDSTTTAPELPARELSTVELWRVCNLLSADGVATTRDGLVESGFTRADAQKFVDDSEASCRELNEGTDASVALASIQESEFASVCETLASSGSADFSSSYLSATFRDDVADEVLDLISERCNGTDVEPPEEAVVSAPPESVPVATEEPPAAPSTTAATVDVDQLNMQIGAALNLRVATDIVDGVFVLPDVDQICVGFDDFFPEGIQHNVTCTTRLSDSARSAFCPAVEAFGRAVDASSTRTEIAQAAEDLVAAAEMIEEPGQVTAWGSTPPDTEILLTGSDLAARHPVRDSAASVLEFWNSADGLDGPSSIAISNDQEVLSQTCDVGLDVDVSIVQDFVRAALPVQRGDEGRAVQEVQLLLILAGAELFPDGADGSFGPGTESMVRDFQVGRGLTATGVVDGPTLDGLRAVEGQLGVIERIEDDPPCPTSQEARDAFVVATGETDRFDVRNPSCSGPWAKVAIVYEDFADGAGVLLEYDGFRWQFRDAGFGDPAVLCDDNNVAEGHRLRLGC